ncbi:MAG: ATP-dependent helicase [Clostridium sp.]|nr:ATP-dependent helicase [Clostridium sp.]
MRELSNAQKEAMMHLLGPAMVTAGPGSGKTFVIVNRILYLISRHHIRPDNILVITYTKAAANEMKERYKKACQKAYQKARQLNEELLSPPHAPAFEGQSPGSVHFGTFHSVCYHILQQSGRIRPDSLIKENDRRKLLEILLGNRGLSAKCDYDTITNLLNVISRMKNFSGGNMMVGRESILPENLEKLALEFSTNELQALKSDYDNYLREQRLIDFDDMIGECLRLLTDNPVVLEKYRQQFQYILADEFQDINSPQYEVLKLLAAPRNNLFVVGDDDQAIYGFRGATPGIMRRFLEDYQGARQVMMTENYRCGAAIVTLSEKVISRNKERFQKKFRPVNAGGCVSAVRFDTRREEEMALIKELAALNESELLNTAVILRTNREAAQYAGLLKEAKIPVKSWRAGRETIFHSFIMKDVTAFLCYLYEGNKRSDFLYFMNKPNRFLSRGALPFEKVSQEQMERYYAKNPQMRLEIAALFRQLEIAAGLSPYLAVSFFRKTWGYDGYLRQRAADYGEYQRLLRQADKVQECFKELRNCRGIREFVENLAERQGSPLTEKQGNLLAEKQDSPLAEKQSNLLTGKQGSSLTDKKGSLLMEKQEGVSILTMHGSKGLEFERVFLPDVNEGIIPGKNINTEAALEEERRLLYVAMTRAKEKLYLYCTKERGRKPSRYLEGLADWKSFSGFSSASS